MYVQQHHRPAYDGIPTSTQQQGNTSLGLQHQQHTYQQAVHPKQSPLVDRAGNRSGVTSYRPSGQPPFGDQSLQATSRYYYNAAQPVTTQFPMAGQVMRTSSSSGGQGTMSKSGPFLVTRSPPPPSAMGAQSVVYREHQSPTIAPSSIAHQQYIQRTPPYDQFLRSGQSGMASFAGPAVGPTQAVYGSPNVQTVFQQPPMVFTEPQTVSSSQQGFQGGQSWRPEMTPMPKHTPTPGASQVYPSSVVRRYEVERGEERLRASQHIQAPTIMGSDQLVGYSGVPTGISSGTLSVRADPQQFPISAEKMGTERMGFPVQAVESDALRMPNQLLNPVVARKATDSPGPAALVKKFGEFGEPAVANAENQAASTPIQVGDTVPPAHIDLHGVCVNLQEYFGDRSGILFGLLAAFHPVDTKQCVPSILKSMEAFERLVDFVGCLVVNDPFVVKAWAKKLGICDQFTFVADSDAKFTRALGMGIDVSDEGLGQRCRRFAAIIGPRAKIRWVGFNEESLAENVLTVLPRYVRTPWKSFLVGLGYTKTARKSADEDAMAIGAAGKSGMIDENDEALNTLMGIIRAQIPPATNNDPNEGKASEAAGNPVLTAIESMQAQLSAQGFCAATDWQLVLSDQMPNVFRPTRENLLSGLKWLVDGAQAGDSLTFYFAGCGALSSQEAEGNEALTILPMDYATAGGVTEKELYDILIPNVPESCRLTIILDVIAREAVSCPLPYVYDLKKHPTAWVKPLGFPQSEIPNLKGEVLVISFGGLGDRGCEMPVGSLARLLAEGASLAPPVKTSAGGPGADSFQENKGGENPSSATSPPVATAPPISYKDKLVQMNKRLEEMGMDDRQVLYRSSVPTSPLGEFTLADVLNAPPSEK